jgi:HK97 family phage major capsid protein
MMSIQALRERKNALVNEARKILADMGDRVWPADIQAKYGEVDNEIERLSGQIEAMQRQLDREAAEDDVPVMNRGDLPKGQQKVMDVFAKWARGGDRAINAEEWGLIRNTMSTTTPAEGGYTVQTTVAESIADAIKTYQGMRQVAEVFTTSTGEPMQFPTTDGTAETGEIVAENTAAADADPSFGAKGLNVYMFSSKVITIPMQLLQDSKIDVLGLINKRLRDRLGRIQNTKFTVGTGTNEPLGLATALGVGKQGTTGQTTSVIYDDLVDLQESVDAGYDSGSNMKWLMHQQSRRVLRKIKDTTGRPIWTPGYESGVTKGAPDELLGRPVQINNDMPTMAASAKSISYGDHSFYKIRDALDIQLFRFNDSVYAKKGQVGFLAFMRSGGAWVDMGGAAKLYQNSAT